MSTDSKDSKDLKDKADGGVYSSFSVVDTPVYTSMDTLNSLSSIKKLIIKPGDETSIEYKTIDKIAKSELDFVLKGMKAISESSLLQSKFGSGLDASLRVAQLIKMEEGRQKFQKSLSSYTNDPLDKASFNKLVDDKSQFK